MASGTNLSQRIRDVFHNFNEEQGKLFSFWFKGNPRTGFGHRGTYTCHERLERMQSRLTKMYNSTLDPETMFEKMDDILSQQVYFGLKLGKVAHADTEGAIDYAMAWLQRLPHNVIQLPDFDLHTGCRIENRLGAGVKDLSCDFAQSVEVVSRYSTTVIRLALSAASCREGPRAIVQQEDPSVQDGFLLFVEDCISHINELAEILEVASATSASGQISEEKSRWFLVRCFLWCNWQRMVMLWLHFQLGLHLKGRKYRYSSRSPLSIRRTFPAPDFSVDNFSEQQAHGTQTPRYVCNWSLELMRSQTCCITGDFRTFFDRYSSVFGDRPSRCNSAESKRTCDGIHPDRCQRFRGMQPVADQSAHDITCSSFCSKLIWDQASFLSCGEEHAHAIDLGTVDVRSGLLRYKSADEDTMAISHVWIAGMGGRPETGLNTCLHQRFATIAQAEGCSSYWMDAACIPAEETLRAQAIKKINDVFASSKVTLVCDQDLQEVNISDADFWSERPDETTVQRAEQLLSALLVSDWNVRAWTFLESVKGRNNLILLCKSNLTVPVLRVLEVLHRHGSIDLAIMALQSPHLFPWEQTTERQMRNLSRLPGDSSLTAEEAGALLSYRPARVPRDEIRIWSLLIKDIDQPYSDPVKFWESRRGTSLHSGFLISTAPRIKKKGLSWAPSRPYAFREDIAGGEDENRFWRAYEGKDTRSLTITKEGLRGGWLGFPFPCMPWHGNMDRAPSPGFEFLPGSFLNHAGIGRSRHAWLKEYPPSIVNELEIIRQKFLKRYRFGQLLLPYSFAVQSKNRMENDTGDIAWVLRMSHQYSTAWQAGQNYYAARHPALERGSLMAVVGTNGLYATERSALMTAPADQPSSSIGETDVRWTWLGIYLWPGEVQMPPFLGSPDLLIG